MTTTIISTNTTAGATLAATDALVVLGTGSIVGVSLIIDGIAVTGQSVSIAGYVELNYMWLGGANTIAIAPSGVFYGHGGGTNIYVGASKLGIVTGGSILTNAGTIIFEAMASRCSGPAIRSSIRV